MRSGDWRGGGGGLEGGREGGERRKKEAGGEKRERVVAGPLDSLHGGEITEAATDYWNED